LKKIFSQKAVNSKRYNSAIKRIILPATCLNIGSVALIIGACYLVITLVFDTKSEIVRPIMIILTGLVLIYISATRITGNPFYSFILLIINNLTATAFALSLLIIGHIIAYYLLHKVERSVTFAEGITLFVCVSYFTYYKMYYKGRENIEIDFIDHK
jgi:hypothetical protein